MCICTHTRASVAEMKIPNAEKSTKKKQNSPCGAANYGAGLILQARATGRGARQVKKKIKKKKNAD